MHLANVRVWDGLEELDRPQAVTWEDDLITDLAPSSAADSPGLSLMPGLIDTHVHLTGPARPGNYTYGTWPLITTKSEQALHAAAHAQSALRHGVTTIRDMASDERPVALRRCFDGGLLQGPRVLAYGVVNMTAGHHDLFTPPDVTDRPVTADGPDACRALVRRHARAGVDGIKVMSGGGVLSSGDQAGWRNYTAEELRAIVDEAHALSLPVAAHAHTEAAITAALFAGVDSLEHGTLLTSAQATEIVRRSITVAPTLVINDGIADGTVAADDTARAKASDLITHRDGRLRHAANAGVRFVLGTDTNGYMLAWDTPLRELQSMQTILGYSAEEALVSATSAAATAVGLDNRIGHIKAGYGSDFLLVRGCPWKDLTQLSTDSIVAVISRGRVIQGELPRV